MPRTFPIRIEVEEIALGPVLRRLHEMEGVAKLNLDLGPGGHKPAVPNTQGNGAQEKAIALLMTGPKHRNEISPVIGGAKSRLYNTINQLKKKKMIKAIDGGYYALADAAAHQLNGQPRALPAPQVPISKGPAGRAGPMVLRAALDAGPVAPSDLRKHMAANGMSPKAVYGVLDRGKKAGLIKKNGSALCELTAKGRAMEAAHG
jgi:hypothetical protein